MPQPAPPLSENAPAKVNLTLEILGRRADGYHLLNSLVGFSDAADIVYANAADGLSLEMRGAFAAPLTAAADAREQNLVMKAASALRERLGVTVGADLVLQKNLPVAAGLGGGSADAAACLRLLQRLWRISLSPERLQDLALLLGADVPVCLNSQTAWMGGIGEEVSPCSELPSLSILLVNPGVTLATAQVFRRADIALGMTPAAAPRPEPNWPALRDYIRSSRNDLQAPAIALQPVIGDVLALLSEQPGAWCARMSGSGATCFALFENASQADAAGRRLRAHRADWWVHAGVIAGVQRQ